MTIMKAVIQSVRLEYRRNSYDKHSFFNNITPFLCVYSYCCERCSSEYVGSTSRTLGTRFSEHLGISPRTSVPLTNPKQSSVRDHGLDCGSDLSMERFSILDSCRGGDLRLLESIYIFKRRPVLNNTASAEPLRILHR